MQKSLRHKHYFQKYCSDNDSLIHATDLVFEGIVNRCLIDRKQWPEGFDIFEQ